MFTALLRDNEISAAQARFQAILQMEMPARHELYTIGYKGGSGPQDRLRANDRIWYVSHKDEDSAIPRYWNAFGLAQNLTTTSSNNIVVELNVPLSGHTKQVGALFARDSKGRLVLLHRGKVGGGRVGVGKDAFLKWYGQGPVEYLNRGTNRTDEALLVARFESDDVVEKVADFVVAVSRFKYQISQESVTAMSDADLKKIATKAKKPHRTTTTVTVITRDQNVVAYVKRRANGRCELCGELAPFEDTKGAPFLECHHVVWLANDGLDSHENAVALCPNCHRKMHVLARKADVETLKKAAS